MEKKERFSWKKDVGVQSIPRTNIDGVDKSIFLEIFPIKGEGHTKFRISIEDGEKTIVSPVLDKYIPHGYPTGYVLDDGKRFVFIASKGIVSCRAPEEGREASIDFIQLQDNKEICSLDYIKDKEMFVAFFDYEYNCSVFDKDFNEIRTIFPQKIGYKKKEPAISYEREKGLITVRTANYLGDGSMAEYEQKIDCLNGEQAISVVSIKGTSINDEQNSIIVPLGEERSTETYEKCRKQARDIILKKTKEVLSKSASEDIKYDFSYCESKVEETVLVLATIEDFPLNYRLSSFHTIIPRFASLKDSYTITPNQEKAPIPYESLFGEIVTDEEKKNGSIKREGINIAIDRNIDNMGNINSPCNIQFEFETVESQNKDGFTGEEFADIVSKQFTTLKSLINVPLLISPEANKTQDDHKKKTLES